MTRDLYGVQSSTLDPAIPVNKTQDPKAALKNAKVKRAISIQSALNRDLANKKNRVKYLQTLHKDRMAEKLIVQAKN